MKRNSPARSLDKNVLRPLDAHQLGRIKGGGPGPDGGVILNANQDAHGLGGP